MTNSNKKTPTHIAFSIRDRGEGKSSKWTEVGVGFTNQDGSVTVLLNAMPLDGKLQIRVNEPREASASHPAAE